MNILTDEEIKEVFDADLYLDFHESARAIEAAVLSKLAEQVGEPVAEVYRAHYGNRVGNIGVDSVRLLRDANVTPGDKLYTEALLIAAQQRTAEACAKVCEIIDEEYEGEDVLGTWCSEAIRNGEWREYL